MFFSDFAKVWVWIFYVYAFLEVFIAMLGLSVYSVYVSVCMCGVRLMYCTLWREFCSLLRAVHQRVFKVMDEPLLQRSVGKNRKTESSGNNCNNFSDGLKHKKRKIRQRCLRRWKNILLYPCPCTRQRMTHWGCPPERVGVEERTRSEMWEIRLRVWRWNSWTNGRFKRDGQERI